MNEGTQYHADGSTDKLIAYSDSDYAGDPETRKNITGYIIIYKGGPISWCSRKQQIIALSSTEAEYIAAFECCKEIMHLKSIIEELTGKTLETKLIVDNQSAISLIKNGIVGRRSKHIDARYRYIHELVKEKVINIEYCPTYQQIADILAKPLGSIKFKNLKNYVVN